MMIFNMSELVSIFKKYFIRLCAISLAISFLAAIYVESTQTYTATLYFQYNHGSAAEGFAPDGESKLDPYEIQNPVIIQGAIDELFADDEEEKIGVEKVRQNIAITKVEPDIEKEIEKSAALAGQKYEVVSTEYEIKYTYDASYGEEYGAKMFSAMMKQYDEYLMNKYYNKKTIVDFTKTIVDTSADYIEIANVMSTNIEDIVAYFNDMSAGSPDYRSKRTGYSFNDIASMYQNLYDIQYAKYYGNVRAGNIAKDPETVIKSYKAKVKELSQSQEINEGISQSFDEEILNFYEYYKKSELYQQALKMQSNLNNTNNRDADVLDDSLIRDFINTYDEIVVSYTDYATGASSDKRTIEYYNTIITSFENDTVPMETKNRLMKINEEIFAEICVLSSDYSLIANETLDEFLDGRVSDDLVYLISPEVVADKPVKLISLLAFILSFGGIFFCIVIYKISASNKNKKKAQELEEEPEEKILLDVEKLNELEAELYYQYLNNFDQFYLVYQPIVDCQSDEVYHYEALTRWKSPVLGNVSPAVAIETAIKLGLFKPVNEWILKNVCANIKARIAAGENEPVVHVNCPHVELSGFALNSTLVKLVGEYDIPAGCICLELDGKNMTSTIEDILLISEMGIRISVDRFENTDEGTEIIQVICPDYVKMSLDSLNFDMLATSGEDMAMAALEMYKYYSSIIDKCNKYNVEVCICGIENEAQDKTIEKLGFAYKQGYYYGKPVKYDV